MPIHDIVDNRNLKLLDQIKSILDSTEAAHFAIGYFFISGFTAISDRLTVGQQYILRELGSLFRLTEAEAIKAQINTLVQIYNQHNLHQWLDNKSLPILSQPIPIVICSGALE